VSLFDVWLFKHAPTESCFIPVSGLSVLEEPLPLTPEIHKVSFQLKLQEVNLEWTVPALTHEELNMIFQIEISRLNISNTIWVVSTL
jgi:hypothetical protein